MRRYRSVEELDADLVDCRRCPRLVRWREQVAREKRAAYADEEYWGRPVPSFGVTAPRLLVVGLAPAAHGANRTGRMFTGDRSGDWLYASLHRVGLANRPTAVHVDDGLELRGTRIVAPVHCAPPDNRPTTVEKERCSRWLDAELRLLAPTLRVVVALGQIGWDAALGAFRRAEWDVPRPKPRFGHGARTVLGAPHGDVLMLGSYHPSQQNTFTGRLTEPMLDAVLGAAAAEVDR